MPFLGAETAFPCVLGRQVASPRPWPRRPKQARFLAEAILADIWAGLTGLRRSAWGFARAKTGSPSNPTNTGGLSSIGYRKGTRLVQGQTVVGFGAVGAGPKRGVRHKTHYLQPLHKRRWGARRLTQSRPGIRGAPAVLAHRMAAAGMGETEIADS